MTLEELAVKATVPGIGIYSVRLHTSGDGFHIEIRLDGLHHPTGAVSSDDCIQYSRRLSDLLEADLLEADLLEADLPETLPEIEEQERDTEVDKQQMQGPYRAEARGKQTDSGDSGDIVIPSRLNAENTSMEVSSTGAERRLRLPDDLERFKGQPLRIRIMRQEKRYKLLAVYIGKEGSKKEEQAVIQEIEYRFNEYKPVSQRKAANRLRKGKAGVGVSEEWTRLSTSGGALSLPLNEILEANLYLDY